MPFISEEEAVKNVLEYLTINDWKLEKIESVAYMSKEEFEKRMGKSIEVGFYSVIVTLGDLNSPPKLVLWVDDEAGSVAPRTKL
ncbi:MAG: hypothetical protein KDA65_11520 [Planctomycetaceae bacterium]|nr:hypothetical protein [Planctomycetaceae bacterium]